MRASIRVGAGHLVVDTMGLLIVVLVTAASVEDRDGGIKVLDRAKMVMPSLVLVWADAAYTRRAQDFAARALRLTVQVVAKLVGQQGFVPLPRRWVVERTHAWITGNRRMSRNYERLPAHSEAMIMWAMIGLMARRLAPAPGRRPGEVLPLLAEWTDEAHAVLADLGYEGERSALTTPIKHTAGRRLTADQRTVNLLHAATCRPAERGNSLLKTTFKALRRISRCPGRIGAITAAALVLLTTSTAAPHDHRAGRAATGNGSMPDGSGRPVAVAGTSTASTTSGRGSTPTSTGSASSTLPIAECLWRAQSETLR